MCDGEMYAGKTYAGKTYAGKTYDSEIGNCNRLSHPMARRKDDLVFRHQRRDRRRAFLLPRDRRTLAHHIEAPSGDLAASAKPLSPLYQTGRRSWTGTI